VNKALSSLLLLSVVAGAPSAQPWTKQRLEVVPGRSIGPVALGRPISKNALETLGPPSADSRREITVKDGGGVTWTDAQNRYINVKCHDGVDPRNVYQVFWTARNPQARGVGVGSAAAAVVKAFPEGRWTQDEMEGKPCWTTPGLRFTCTARTGRVSLMHLYKP
jgi:hypothetical protein